MDPIVIPNDRKPILVIHPRHRRHIKYAVGVILVAAPGVQAAPLRF